jgi:hypothetical protein
MFELRGASAPLPASEHEAILAKQWSASPEEGHAMKIGVIGAGAVGSAAAYAVVVGWQLIVRMRPFLALWAFDYQTPGAITFAC